MLFRSVARMERPSCGRASSPSKPPAPAKLTGKIPSAMQPSITGETIPIRKAPVVFILAGTISLRCGWDCKLDFWTLGLRLPKALFGFLKLAFPGSARASRASGCASQPEGRAPSRVETNAEARRARLTRAATAARRSACAPRYHVSCARLRPHGRSGYGYCPKKALITATTR